MEPQALWGAVDMLILEVVSAGPSYGYDITQQVFSRSQGYFELKEGSLYPALHKLEQQKFLSSSWEQVEGRRRKYYRLTSTGQKHLEVRKQAWRDYAKAIEGVLGGSGEWLVVSS
jgi:transcriptional regulator